jgi:hypothetical protein
MHAHRVGLIPFEFQRNLLFVDENLQPQRLRTAFLFVP